MKTCSKCKQDLPLNAFHKKKASKSGLKSQCKICRHLQYLARTPNCTRSTEENHGMYLTKIYQCWTNMKSRVNKINAPYYKYYGGRGITVCERWKKFTNFFTDMGHVPPGLSIDRINNDGNYEPGNCRWATKFEQTHNRRPRGSLPLHSL